MISAECHELSDLCTRKWSPMSGKFSLFWPFLQLSSLLFFSSAICAVEIEIRRKCFSHNVNDLQQTVLEYEQLGLSKYLISVFYTRKPNHAKQ